MTTSNDDFVDDFIENPEKFEQHLEELMSRIKKNMQETADESCKKFFERYGL